jgi:hypothetical protein
MPERESRVPEIQTMTDNPVNRGRLHAWHRFGTPAEREAAQRKLTTWLEAEDSHRSGDGAA